MGRKRYLIDRTGDRPAARAMPTALQSAFIAAVRHHQGGLLNEAETLYRQVLAADPRHADSLHLLGVVAFQTGRSRIAVELIRKAINIKGNVAAYHSNLGNALKEQGRLTFAFACYRKALALEPDFAAAHCNLGNALKALGHLEDAVGCYRKSLALDPGVPDTYYNLGNTLRDQGRTGDAATCYRQAVKIKPDFAEALNNLGGMLKELGQFAEAVDLCRKAISLKPDYPDAHNNLGAALEARGEPEEALHHLRRALELRPNDPNAHNNLGNTLRLLGRLDETLECHTRALELAPDDPEAHNNLGTTYCELRQLDAAIACYRKAIALKQDHQRAHTNLGLMLLAQGDMSAGWEEYEWRRKSPTVLNERQFTQPQWRGEAAEGRTLLVHAEQGFGDTLQFCRYGPLAAARGLRVVMEVQEPLVRLLRTLPAVDVLPAGVEALPQFDFHCPMLSLPLALGTTITSIPATVSYLHADEDEAATWKARLTELANQGLRVGLAWGGSASYAANRRRSLSLDRLARLFDISGLHFFSLQKDRPAPPGEFPLTDCMDRIKDFADTAALIANLDLVISADTAVAHLAAALGKPVWLLDRFDADWRWLTGRSDSPWYPTLRIYRQPTLGDWDWVLTRVVEDLRGLVEARE
jgi:tetratricopeptide (TPR) repeat protein